MVQKAGLTLRWAPVSLQPAKKYKLSTILYLSVVISKHKEKFEQSNLKSDTLLLIKSVALQHYLYF